MKMFGIVIVAGGVLAAIALYLVSIEGSAECLSIQELRSNGWIPDWVPRSTKIRSNGIDLNLNTSETSTICDDVDFLNLVKYLETSGNELSALAGADKVGERRGRYFCKDGYLIVINKENNTVVYFASWNEDHKSRYEIRTKFHAPTNSVDHANSLKTNVEKRIDN